MPDRPLNIRPQLAHSGKFSRQFARIVPTHIPGYTLHRLSVGCLFAYTKHVIERPAKTATPTHFHFHCSEP